jgi:hypothetical protein
MPANVIPVYETINLRFILHGIPLQPGNPFFHRAAKPWTDLKAFLRGAIGDHGWHLNAEIPRASKNFIAGLKFFLPVPILEKTHFLRQITTESAAGNALSKNNTVGPLFFENGLDCFNS